MSDDGGSDMDLCECVWGHEMAMRRLLSLLRQSQSLCTDTECFNPTSQQQQLNNNNADVNLLMISLMIVFAIALYLLRPRSITNSNADHIKKPSNPNSEFGPEYWKYKVPPIQECQFKHNFILYLNQSRNSSSVNTNKDSIIIDTNKDNVIDITTDTTDDDDNDERLSVEMEIIPNIEEPVTIPLDSTDTNSQDELHSSNKNNDTNRIDNENGDSNQESSDGLDNIDNNTSSSTFSNNDNKSTPTLARTPLLSKVSTYKTLPEMENFGKEMGPLIMFENLSDSVGTYNKMKGLLNKVRTTLKSIHPYSS